MDKIIQSDNESESLSAQCGSRRIIGIICQETDIQHLADELKRDFQKHGLLSYKTDWRWGMMNE